MGYSTEILSGLTGLGMFLVIVLGLRLRQGQGHLQHLEMAQVTLEHQNQSLQTDNQKLKEALDLAQQVVSSLQQQLAETGQSAEVQQQQAEQQTAFAQLTARQASLEKTLAERHQTLSDLEAQVAELIAAKVAAEQTLKTEKTEYQRHLQVLTHEATTLKTALSEADAQQTQMQQQLTEALHQQAPVEANPATISELQGTVAELNPGHIQTRSFSYGKNSSSQIGCGLETQKGELSQQRQVLAQSLDETQARISDLENQNTALTHQNQTLEKSLADTQATVATFQAQIAALEDQANQSTLEPPVVLQTDAPAPQPTDTPLAENTPDRAATSQANTTPTPLAPETKPLGKQADKPFVDKTVVITGRLKVLSPQQAEQLVMEAGGKVTKMPSSKTGFVVVGYNAGSSKLKKAAKYNIPQLTEAQFLALLDIEPPEARQ